MASLIAMMSSGDDHTDAATAAALHDAAEDAGLDAPVVTVPTITPEMQERIKEIWKQVGEEQKIEDQSRREADANGTVSAYDVPIDERGHGHAHRKTTSRRLLDRHLADSGKDAITHQPLTEYDITRGTAPDDDILSLASLAGMYRECHWCGEMPVYSYDGTTLTSTTACTKAEGFTTTVTLRVTSGKIVVADSLRNVYNLTREQEDALGDYNSAWGQAEWMHAYEALGCAYGPVGNSCPSLYQTGEDTYAIVSPAYDEDTDTSTFDGTHLAGITTDLWAYSIADHDDYLAKGGTIGEYGPEVVEVPNGLYTFSHHTHERAFNYDDYRGTQVYATIVRTDG